MPKLPTEATFPSSLTDTKPLLLFFLGSSVTNLDVAAALVPLLFMNGHPLLVRSSSPSIISIWCLLEMKDGLRLLMEMDLMPILLQRVLISSKILTFLPSTMLPSTCILIKGYDYSWGSQWIEQHSAAGRSVGKPLVLEEYGSKINDTEFEIPWQTTLLQNSSVAYDSFWQFGSSCLAGRLQKTRVRLDMGQRNIRS